MVLERYRGERVVNVPNAVTIGRVIGGTREAWRYYNEPQMLRLWSTGLFFSLDLVDGWLARRLHQTTQAGGDLDKIGDKLTGGLLLAGGLRHGSADKAVVVAVAAINARRTVPEGVPDINRTTQAMMNYGVGFNMIGNHLQRESASRRGRRVGQVLRVAGGVSALVGATVLGTTATAKLWRTVLAGLRTP
jgi:hypothetical protein